MSEDYQFPGFSKPSYTQVPDEFFDELMPRLSESELKVLLYVIRRTFGFKKNSDAISLRQMVEGIKTKDGRQLDNGTGLSRPGVTKGVRGLISKGALVASRNSSAEKGDEPTTYQLRFAEINPLSAAPSTLPVATTFPGGSKNRYDGGGNIVSSPRRNDIAPQETVKQQTAIQEIDDSNYSKETDPLLSNEETERITWLVRDIARELHDQAPLKSTTTRVLTLYARSGLELEPFLDLLQAARVRTQRYSAGITAEAPASAGGWTQKNKTPYFLTVLADLASERKQARSG